MQRPVEEQANSSCMFLSGQLLPVGYVVSTAGPEEDEVLEKTVRELSLSIRESLVLHKTPPVTARDIVLKKCGQTQPLNFEECYLNS